MPQSKQPHSHHRERLRKRAREEGLSSFEPHEALELLLFYAIPRVNTNEIAHALLDRFGSFAAVLDADYSQLVEVPGMGENSATFLTLLPEFFMLYGRDRLGSRPQLNTRAKAGEYCLHLFAQNGNEAFWVLCLDTHKRLLHSKLLFSGTPSETPILVRKIAEYVLQQRASSVLLCHNHPSGSPEPSVDDYATTHEIVVALATLGIAVDDHILVAGGRALHFMAGDEGDPFAVRRPVLLNAADSPDPKPRSKRKKPENTR